MGVLPEEEVLPEPEVQLWGWGETSVPSSPPETWATSLEDSKEKPQWFLWALQGRVTSVFLFLGEIMLAAFVYSEGWPLPPVHELAVSVPRALGG